MPPSSRLAAGALAALPKRGIERSTLTDFEQTLRACMIILVVNPTSQQWMSTCISAGIHGPSLSLPAARQVRPAALCSAQHLCSAVRNAQQNFKWNGFLRCAF